jgi:hypothetical protein
VLNLLVLLTILPLATLVAVPTSRALAQGRTSLVMAGLLAWLLIFWTTTLTLAWPLLAGLAATIPL